MPRSPSSHFPHPSWYQTVGEEEPKSRCRQQNALEGRVQISLRCFGLYNLPQHLPAEAKGIAGINNATVSAIKRKMEGIEAVPISTHRSLVARAGLASAGSRLCRGNKKQNNTNLVQSYGLRFGGEIKKKSYAGKLIWETREAVSCAEHQNLWRCSAKYSPAEKMFSLSHHEWIQAICHKRALIGFMARFWW